METALGIDRGGARGAGGADRPTAWVIWSEEHGAWWAPGGHGYILSLRQAGRYSAERAAAIVARANAHCRPGEFCEIAIPDPLSPNRDWAP